MRSSNSVAILIGTPAQQVEALFKKWTVATESAIDARASLVGLHSTSLQLLNSSLSGINRHILNALTPEFDILICAERLGHEPAGNNLVQLKRRGSKAALNGWSEEAKNDLEMARAPNYQDYQVHFMLGALYRDQFRNFQ